MVSQVYFAPAAADLYVYLTKSKVQNHKQYSICVFALS